MSILLDVLTNGWAYAVLFAVAWFFRNRDVRDLERRIHTHCELSDYDSNVYDSRTLACDTHNVERDYIPEEDQ